MYKYRLTFDGVLVDESDDMHRLWQIAVDLYKAGMIGIELIIIGDAP